MEYELEFFSEAMLKFLNECPKNGFFSRISGGNWNSTWNFRFSDLEINSTDDYKISAQCPLSLGLCRINPATNKHMEELNKIWPMKRSERCIN